jgi:Flp pilus assembly protein CpaB
MNRRKGWLWIAGGIVLALLAGVLVFTMVVRTADPSSQALAPEATGPKVRVVVAAHEIPQHTVIEKADLSVKGVPADAVPDGALLGAVESAVGRISQRTISAGEVLVSDALATYTPGSGEDVAFTTLGSKVVVAQEDQVLFAIPPLDLMSTKFLEVGNHVDVLVSLAQQQEAEGSVPPRGEDQDEGESARGPAAAPPVELVTAYTIQNAEVAAIKYAAVQVQASKGGPQLPGNPDAPSTEPESGVRQALLVAVDPQDALILKHLVDRGAMIDVALRAPSNDQLFDTQPVDSDYLYDRYRLPREP